MCGRDSCNAERNCGYKQRRGGRSSAFTRPSPRFLVLRRLALTVSSVFTSPARAVNAVAAGRTVVFRAGTYRIQTDRGAGRLARGSAPAAIYRFGPPMSSRA